MAKQPPLFPTRKPARPEPETSPEVRPEPETPRRRKVAESGKDSVVYATPTRKCYNCDEMVVPDGGRCPYCTGRV
jgi:hypothetical protein